jgi:hypothetical protein
MGHPDCERIVYVFRDHWPGRWASEYQVILSWRMSALIVFFFQAFRPANAIFAGIGVLLSVGVIHLPCVTYFDTAHRRLKMRALAETNLSIS